MQPIMLKCLNECNVGLLLTYLTYDKFFFFFFAIKINSISLLIRCHSFQCSNGKPYEVILFDNQT